MHADLVSPTVSEIRSLEVVPASRFPGYRPIAVVEIGRSQLGVNFRTPVSRKPSVRSASNFGSLLPWPSPFVWHRSDVDPTVGFRVGEGAPKFSTSPNSRNGWRFRRAVFGFRVVRRARSFLPSLATLARSEGLRSEGRKFSLLPIGAECR
jgi:hypothetical protein